MPVSPMTGNGNSCGAGPLPDTTSRYLVGSAGRISIKDMGIDLLPAIRPGRIKPTKMYRPLEPTTDTQGDVCEEQIITRGTC